MRMAAKEKVDEWDEDWMENKEREDEEVGKKDITAVTRIRTWVTAATTQGPNH